MANWLHKVQLHADKTPFSRNSYTLPVRNLQLKLLLIYCSSVFAAAKVTIHVLLHQRHSESINMLQQKYTLFASNKYIQKFGYTIFC